MGDFSWFDHGTVDGPSHGTARLGGLSTVAGGEPARSPGRVVSRHRAASTVVVKVGSSSVTTATADRLRGGDICPRSPRFAGGHTVVVVTSGAIAAGWAALGRGEQRPADPAVLQAVSAVGQHRLMRTWQDGLGAARAPGRPGPAGPAGLRPPPPVPPRPGDAGPSPRARRGPGGQRERRRGRRGDPLRRQRPPGGPGGPPGRGPTSSCC